MFTTTLSDRELETVILALKYWRGRRVEEEVRRTDDPLTRPELDVLLSKLGTGTMSTLPSHSSFSDLFRLD